MLQANFKKSIEDWLVTSVIIISSLYCLHRHVMLAINTTGSLPQHLFIVLKGKPVTRGDYVAFYPPVNPLYRADTVWIKKVAGIPGDKVTVYQRQVWVNDQWIGIAQAYSSHGLPLTPCQAGLLGKEQYFVYTSHPKSFDSRYAELGWLSKRAFMGTAYPMF